MAGFRTSTACNSIKSTVTVSDAALHKHAWPDARHALQVYEDVIIRQCQRFNTQVLTNLLVRHPSSALNTS